MSPADAYAEAVRACLNISPMSSALAVVDAAMGKGAIYFRPGGRDAYTIRLNGRWYLVLRERLSGAECSWAMAMAFSRWALAYDGISDLDVEAVARAFAYPRAAASLLAEHGAEAEAARLNLPIDQLEERARELGLVPLATVTDLSGARARRLARAPWRSMTTGDAMNDTTRRDGARRTAHV